MNAQSLVTQRPRSKPRWALRRMRAPRQTAAAADSSVIPGFVIHPDPLGLTRPLTVLVYPDRATLNDWLTDDEDLAPGSTDSAAVSTWSDGDDMELTIRLDRRHLELSIVAHEVTHIVLAVYSRDVLTPSARASAHITHHDETIPELVGNLTAFVWFGLISHGHITEETS
jgi:hypothetical protein